MGGIRSGAAAAALVAVVLSLPGCELPGTSSTLLDLPKNGTLYQPVGYAARLAADRPVYVAPLVDARAATAVDASGPLPVVYMGDGSWERTPIEMVEEVLLDELDGSGIAGELVDTLPPPADAVVLRASLMTFRGGQEEHPFGRRSIGEVGMRIEVFGPLPEGADDRPLLLERELGEIVSTDVSVKPKRVPQVVGSALRGAIVKVLATLDQSNVTRSGVPQGLPVHAEPPPPPPKPADDGVIR